MPPQVPGQPDFETVHEIEARDGNRDLFAKRSAIADPVAGTTEALHQDWSSLNLNLAYFAAAFAEFLEDVAFKVVTCPRGKNYLANRATT